MVATVDIFPAQKPPAVILPAKPDAARPDATGEIARGALLQLFQISTLGQPFEVIKTHMAAHRGDSLPQTIKNTWARGGVLGFYQGLIPWAWIECSTKGAVLMLVSSEIDYNLQANGVSKIWSKAIAGMGGGVAQAYTTMGICTFMKTVEVTRAKSGPNAPGTIQVAADVFRKEGIVGLNKGVSAVALRQFTNWGGRFGITAAISTLFQGGDPKKKLTGAENIAASALGGALACWNQPLEVIRVEMQKVTADRVNQPKLNIWTAAQRIYSSSGLSGFYRGVLPRMGLSSWQTVVMVYGASKLKEWSHKDEAAAPS